MKRKLYVQDCGVVTPIGAGREAVAQALFQGRSDGIKLRNDIVPGQALYLGAVENTLPQVPAGLEHFDCRNNRMMMMALMEIAPSVERIKARYGAARIAVILGTSTSGIASSEQAYFAFRRDGVWSETFDYRQHELGSISAFTAALLGVHGPAYTVATACSSSAKVFASARRLIDAGFADAAIVGGCDTLCYTTLRGFNSLEIASKSRCNPFSVNRDGINIGEGAAAFLLTREEGPVEMLGVGESSDAYHLTAPSPDGEGAQGAMNNALADANLKPAHICYVNLHGTATPLNDAMESHAIAAVFGEGMVCSSTKGMTGHMLGAAGACEAAFLWVTLNPAMNTGLLPPPSVGRPAR